MFLSIQNSYVLTLEGHLIAATRAEGGLVLFVCFGGGGRGVDSTPLGHK